MTPLPSLKTDLRGAASRLREKTAPERPRGGPLEENWSGSPPWTWRANEKRSSHVEKIIYVLVGRVWWPNIYRRRWCPLGM